MATINKKHYAILTSAQLANRSWLLPRPIPHPLESHPQLLPVLYHHCKIQRLQVKSDGNLNFAEYLPAM